MLKKLVSILLIAVIISLCGLTAFADPTDGFVSAGTGMQEAAVDSTGIDPLMGSVEGILNKAVEVTEQFIVTITKPNSGKNLAYKKTYVISGVTAFEDVRIVLKKYDSEEKGYLPLEDEDGKSQWDVGSFGVFAREITLTKGVNEIRILAYRTSKADSLKVSDVQVMNFTITLLDESIKDRILNTIIDIKNAFLDMLSK